MNPLFFVTDKQEKLRKVQAVPPTVEGIEPDLSKIQELNSYQVIVTSLGEA